MTRRRRLQARGNRLARASRARRAQRAAVVVRRAEPGSASFKAETVNGMLFVPVRLPRHGAA